MFIPTLIPLILINWPTFSDESWNQTEPQWTFRPRSSAIRNSGMEISCKITAKPKERAAIVRKASGNTAYEPATAVACVKETEGGSETNSDAHEQHEPEGY
jgi:hypothetical protein